MITVTMTPPEQFADATERKLRRWTKEGLMEGLAAWVRERLPMHFSVYAYSNWPEVYKLRKVRRRRGGLAEGAGRPLYDTGVSHDMAIHQTRITGMGGIGPGLIGAKAIIPAHRHLQWLKAQGVYDPQAEVTAVTESEMKHIADIVDKHIQTQIDAEKAIREELGGEAGALLR